MSFVAKLIGGPAYAGLATLGRHWKLFGLALLLAAIGIQQLRVTGLKSSLNECQAGRLADQESYKRAQAEAEAKALAAHIKTEKQYAQAAQAADADYDALRSRYAGIMRAKAAGGTSGRSIAAAQGGDPGVHEVAAPVPIYIQTLSDADWLKLPDLQAYADGCFVLGRKLEKVE